MVNVIVVLFEVESEAYKALAKLKREFINPSYIISQMGVIENKDARLHSLICGIDTPADNTPVNCLIGSLFEIMGEPIAVFLSGSSSIPAEITRDSDDAPKNSFMLEYIAEKLKNGSVMIAALVQETDNSSFDRHLANFKVEIRRWDAAVVAMEIEEAKKLAGEIQLLIRERMQQQKKETRMQDWEQKHASILADFESFSLKIQKD